MSELIRIVKKGGVIYMYCDVNKPFLELLKQHPNLELVSNIKSSHQDFIQLKLRVR